MDAVIALALVLATEKTKRRKRKAWTKKWLLDKKVYGHSDLLKELKLNEPTDYINFLRMDAAAFTELLTLVTPYIQKEDTVMRTSISPTDRLSLTLRYLATGNTFEDLKFITAISPQAIGRIIMETCDAIIRTLKAYIQLPGNQQEWKKVSDDFTELWNFPHCLGVIDGKHIAIKKPLESGSLYFNYKKFFSIVLMAVVNARYEFMMVDVGVNGRVSDGGVISYTRFGDMLNEHKLSLPDPGELHENDKVPTPYTFVADDAFAMTENLLKPFSEARGNLKEDERIFNYRLSRARRVVENAFGILASRFGTFQKPILLAPEKAQTVTLACCYLHNFLRRKAHIYLAKGSIDWVDEDQEFHEGEWRESQTELLQLLPTKQRNPGARAKFTRETFKHYFSSIGMVPWQCEYIA